MNYPNNRLIINGVDLTERYGLILADGYSIDPPEPKTYKVDIPGGNGVMDLTETLLGDVSYENRKMEFELYIVGLSNAEEFEQFMNEIKTFVHGKAFDFKITMDPKYTYHGRFTISDIKHSMYSNGLAGYFKITVDAEPFKYLDDQIYKVNAVGGKIVYFESGRKRVRPVIETDGLVKVIFKDKEYILTQGTWTINDVLFTSGINEIYFNSYDIKNLTWSGLKQLGITWKAFKEKRLYEWYKSGNDGNQLIKTWTDLADKTWTDLADKTWSDMSYMTEITGTINDIYIKYKVGDL